jgi:hypothetical protein
VIIQKSEGGRVGKEVTIMKAHGTVMRGYDIPSDHSVRERVKGWMRRAFTQKNVKVVAASVIGLLLFGMMIWLFYQSIVTLNKAELPADLTLYLF